MILCMLARGRQWRRRQLTRSKTLALCMFSYSVCENLSEGRKLRWLLLCRKHKLVFMGGMLRFYQHKNQSHFINLLRLKSTGFLPVMMEEGHSSSLANP